MTVVEKKQILPSSGVWSIEDLAKYIEISPDTLQQTLTTKGIKVLILGKFYRQHLIRLEDLK